MLLWFLFYSSTIVLIAIITNKKVVNAICNLSEIWHRQISVYFISYIIENDSMVIIVAYVNYGVWAVPRGCYFILILFVKDFV